MTVETLNVEIVTPEELFFSGDATLVEIPGKEGNFGVLPNHAPLISSLKPGIIDIFVSETKKKQIFVSGGFAEVSGTSCIILAEEAFHLSDIDSGLVHDRLQVAEEAIKSANSDIERLKATKLLEAAEAMKAIA